MLCPRYLGGAQHVLQVCSVAQPSGELCVQDSEDRAAAGSDGSAGARAADADRSFRRNLAREHEREGAEHGVGPNRGRVVHADFHGFSGRQGTYGFAEATPRDCHRSRRLAQLRKDLDEAQMMKPILVGRRRRMLRNAVQSAEGLRTDSGGGPHPEASARGAAGTAAGTSSSPRSADKAGSKGRQGAIAGNKPEGAVGNVVTHNLPISNSSRRISPGFAVHCPPGVVLPILPDVMAVNGPLGVREMEEIASHKVLSSILTLEVPKELCSVSLDGDTKKFKQSIQFKAASLSRLMARAQQRHSAAFMILIHCRNPTMQPVAHLIAAWLHWMGRMGIEEACDRAGAACGCYVPRTLLDQANIDLYNSAQTRRSRRLIDWAYGAYASARVAGELVGSWHVPVDMKPVSWEDSELYGRREGDWVLLLPDLEPGLYR